MARREAIFTITDEGRDKGKVFKLTEMDSAKAEDLCLQALFLLSAGGIGMPEDVQGTGALGVATAGYEAFMRHVPYKEIKPILDEMWKCIEYIPNPSNHNLVRPLNPNGSDIEEVLTRLRLRMEVFNLHVGFSTGEETSKSIPTAAETSPPQSSRTMPTSRARSAQSSVLDARR